MSNNSNRKGHPVLAFFLGFLLAIILILGLLAGVVYFVLTYKIDKISANKDSEGNYVYINADESTGGASTLLSLIKKVSSMVEDVDSLTLGEIDSLVPAVSPLIEQLELSLDDIVTLEEDELRNVKLGELESFFSDLENRIEVTKIIHAKPDNAILTYLCYAVTDVEYDGATGQYTAKYKKDGAVYDSVVEVDEQGNLANAYYLSDGTSVNIPALTAKIISERIDGLMEDMTISQIIDIPDDNKILGSVKNSTINSLSDDVNKLGIQQLSADDVYGGAQYYLAVSGDGSLYEADEYFADYIYYTAGDDGYVLAGGNGKLTEDEFASGIEQGSVYYTAGEGRILYDSAYLYYSCDGEDDYSLLNAGTGNDGRLSSFAEGYYTYGAPTQLWKLLVYSETTEGSGTKEEQFYSVNNITEMINNVSKNTQTTSLRNLDAAGVLTFSNKSDLDIILSWTESGEVHSEVLGDMPLSEVINVTVLIARDPTVLVTQQTPLLP